MSSQVSNLFLPKLSCTRIQSVIEMMFVSCMCLFSLPLVPVPAEVPSGTSPSQRGMCNATLAGSQLSLQVTRCQLKKQCLYKAPPPSSAQKRALSLEDRTKEIIFLFLFSQGTPKLACSCMQKDIHSFHDYYEMGELWGSAPHGH